MENEAMREILNYASEAFEQSVYPRIGLYIDGEWIYDRKPFLNVINPSTENVLAEVPTATDEDLLRVLAAAQKGFRIWSAMAPRERVDIIMRAVGLLRERTKDIAKILTLENGKHLAGAEAEISRCGNFYEWDAQQSLRSYGTIVPGEPQMQKFVLRQPIGPVVAFTPWNVPMSSAARKSSAALAAGCSVILKAAEETPGTACALIRCFEDAGLPAGVLNLVFGDPSHISSTLIASPITRLVTFTGSTGVGKHLSELAARAMKPVLMELGGNAPVIVDRDVNARNVGRLSAMAKANATGQICASPSRFIVHRDSYDLFVSSFAETFEHLRVGDGYQEGVQMGPVANARRLAAAQAMAEDTLRRGGRFAAGGHRIGGRGYFFEPTLIVDVPLDSDAMTVEPFGPLAACVAVSDIDEAIEVANSLSVGLAAYAFSNSLETAELLGRRLECGILSINHFGTPDADTPFGGIKDSGVGREGGPTTLDAYLVSKTVLQSTVRV
jgi:succinate-semialdehyde dehydrogenase/glutarate-semialdehyde dehydrogenase